MKVLWPTGASTTSVVLAGAGCGMVKTVSVGVTAGTGIGMKRIPTCWTVELRDDVLRDADEVPAAENVSEICAFVMARVAFAPPGGTKLPLELTLPPEQPATIATAPKGSSAEPKLPWDFGAMRELLLARRYPGPLFVKDCDVRPYAPKIETTDGSTRARR